METNKKTVSLIALGAAVLIGAGIASYFICRARRSRMEQEGEECLLEMEEEADELNDVLL